jgi:broad specificity phosphatase PhoE
MGWPRKLILVRHAESEGNTRSADERAGYDVSSHEYPLTPRGRKQAKITGKYLQKKFGTFDVYYVSYYQRSKETMHLMYPKARVYEDPRLAEAQRGIWHIMTKDQLQSRFPEEIARKEREGLYHYRPLGGENWPDIELRIHSFLGTLCRDYEGQDVCIVGHGHWLILFDRLVRRFSIDEAVTRYKAGSLANASVTIFKSKKVKGKQRLVLEEENIIPWKGKV